MPETVNPEQQLTSLLVRTMALLCVRNTMLEDIHAGLVPDHQDRRLLRRHGDRRRRPANSVARRLPFRRRNDARPDAPSRRPPLHVPGPGRRTRIPGSNRPLDGRREPLGRTAARPILLAHLRRRDRLMTQPSTTDAGRRYAFAPPIRTRSTRFAIAFTSCSKSPMDACGPPEATSWYRPWGARGRLPKT